MSIVNNGNYVITSDNIIVYELNIYIYLIIIYFLFLTPLIKRPYYYYEKSLAKIRPINKINIFTIAGV